MRIDPVHRGAQLGAAQVLLSMDRLAEAEPRLRALTEVSPSPPGAWIGLAQVSRRRGDLSGALTLLEAAAVRHPANDAIQAMTAGLLVRLSRFKEAEALYRAVLDRAPEHLESLQGVAEVAVRTRDFEAALERLQRAAQSHPGEVAITFSIIGVLFELERLDAAEAILEGLRESHGASAELWALFGRLQRLRSRDDLALPHFVKAAGMAPKVHRYRYQVVATLRDLGRVDDADAEMARMEQLVGPDDPEFQLRTFEHLCFALRLDQALGFLARWKRPSDVPKGAVVSALMLYASLQRWDDVLDFVRERIASKGWQGRFVQIGEIVLRAARQTGRYEEARALLEQSAARLRTPDIVQAQARLRAEIDLLHSLEPLMESPADEQEQAASARQAARASIGGSGVARPSVEIFTCADGNYLIGAAVCIFSLLRHNAEHVNNCAITLFCADDVLTNAADIFSPIGAHFGTDIRIRAASTIIPPGLALRSSWGVLTPGRSMATSAYHRIFAARRLAHENPAARAIYFDADTCIGPGLEQLINYDLHGNPLGARREDPNERNVRRAASILNIEVAQYFNSGVLVFDLSHPALAGALDRAIEIAESEQERLTFHDQCALNLAFRDQCAALPEIYNHFIKPEFDEIPSDTTPVVTHFTSLPKPWDPMNLDGKKAIWLEERTALEKIVGAGRLGRTMALLFPLHWKRRAASGGALCG